MHNFSPKTMTYGIQTNSLTFHREWAIEAHFSESVADDADDK
jgi:hypothetical protein